MKAQLFLLYGAILVFIIICAIFEIFYEKSLKKFGFLNKKNKELDKQNKQLQQDIDKQLKSVQEVRDNYNNEVVRLTAELDTIKRKSCAATLDLEKLDKEIQLKKDFNASLLKMREDELNRQIETMRTERLMALDKEYDDAVDEYHRAIEITKQDEYKIYLESKAALQKDIDDTKAILEDFRVRREAVNQEILRQRELEEKQDFYRIQLDDCSIRDIAALNEIKPRLNKINLLDKLIYENYIARPSKEMVKRVLEGKNPSGIYKVTNIKTKEIYIGKSVKVADRFVNHIKSACGLEGVAESQFQRALKKYGVDCFTWELLEECSKEKLSERECYYIELYNTITYGYNMRLG